VELEPSSKLQRHLQELGVFELVIIGADMPKSAHIIASFPASKISSQKSGGHPLVTIALFSGLGLLASLITILCGVQVVWF
jgi:hypothetical protein